MKNINDELIDLRNAIIKKETLENENPKVKDLKYSCINKCSKDCQ